MAGPTPVSALIHAATMVTAGVYLLVRTYTLWDLATGVAVTVGYVGILTAFFAATLALVQVDLKKIPGLLDHLAVGFHGGGGSRRLTGSRNLHPSRPCLL